MVFARFPFTVFVVLSVGMVTNASAQQKFSRGVTLEPSWDLIVTDGTLDNAAPNTKIEYRRGQYDHLVQSPLPLTKSNIEPHQDSIQYTFPDVDTVVRDGVLDCQGDDVLPFMKTGLSDIEGLYVADAKDCTLVVEERRGVISFLDRTALGVEAGDDLINRSDFGWMTFDATSILSSLSVPDSEITVSKVDFLYSDTEIDGETVSNREGVVVSFERSIDDVPVMGSSASVCYNMQGEIISFKMAWPEIANIDSIAKNPSDEASLQKKFDIVIEHLGIRPVSDVYTYSVIENPRQTDYNDNVYYLSHYAGLERLNKNTKGLVLPVSVHVDIEEYFKFLR